MQVTLRTSFAQKGRHDGEGAPSIPRLDYFKTAVSCLPDWNGRAFAASVEQKEAHTYCNLRQKKQGHETLTTTIEYLCYGTVIVCSSVGDENKVLSHLLGAHRTHTATIRHIWEPASCLAT